jgi:hypothetical protein
MTSATSIAFSIESPSATGRTERAVQVQQIRTLPTWAMLGTLLLLAGAPAVEDAKQIVPSAARPPMLYGLTEVDGQERYLPSSAVEHSITRLREFGKYHDDWDGSGAQAPSQDAINTALQFLTSLEPWHPAPFATMSRLGEPVIEFEEASAGLFGSIRFLDKTSVELYAKFADNPSRFFSGDIYSMAAREFLSVMNLPAL